MPLSLILMNSIKIETLLYLLGLQLAIKVLDIRLKLKSDHAQSLRAYTQGKEELNARKPAE